MTNKSNIYFVDLQGIVDRHTFILKELAIVECDDIRGSRPILGCTQHKTHHYIFKPPFEWKELHASTRLQAFKSKCFHNGFSWNSGDTSYSEIDEIIRRVIPEGSEIYVLGERRKEWFKQLTAKKFKFKVWDDIEVYHHQGTPTCERDNHCKKHSLSLHCARQNAWFLHFYVRVLH